MTGHQQLMDFLAHWSNPRLNLYPQMLDINSKWWIETICSETIIFCSWSHPRLDLPSHMHDIILKLIIMEGLSGLQSADLATPTSNCWGSVTGWWSGGSVRGWERDMAQQGEVQCHCQLCFCQTDDWTAAGNGFFGTLISPKDWSALSNDRTQLTMMYRDNWIRS